MLDNCSNQHTASIYLRYLVEDWCFGALIVDYVQFIHRERSHKEKLSRPKREGPWNAGCTHGLWFAPGQTCENRWGFAGLFGGFRGLSLSTIGTMCHYG